MTPRAIALLDPPSSAFFCSVPWLVESGQRIEVCGWPEMVRKERGADEVEELVSAGYALRLDEPIPVSDGFCGRLGWIGAGFWCDASDADCFPIELLPASLHAVGAQGHVWVPRAPGSVSELLQQWLHETATQVLTSPIEQRRPLAFLMERCDPDDELTRAAVWWAFEGNGDEQEQHVRWIERLARDRGEALEFTPERQRACYEGVRRRLLESHVRRPSLQRKSTNVRQAPMPIPRLAEREAA